MEKLMLLASILCKIVSVFTSLGARRGFYIPL